MRLSTITNWAYGVTVALSLASGVTMLAASNAQDREREAVKLRYEIDQATENLGSELYRLTENARQYVNTGDPTYEIVYRSTAEDLGATEERIRHLEKAGVAPEELTLVEEAIGWADALHDEQDAAIKAYNDGDEGRARLILFGAEYERELDRAELLLLEFRERLDSRISAEVQDAADLAHMWKRLSEIVIGITGLLFLCVLYFIFKQRVLRPVVKLSDVVGRLAAQDYDAQLPDIDQIDEIGDMAQAIRVFRENGLERQRLEAERHADRQVRDTMSRMTQRMQGCDTLDDLARVVERFLPLIVPDRSGRLYVLDKQRNSAVEVCNWSDPQHSRKEFPPLNCWAMRRGLPHRLSPGQVDVPCEHLALAAGETVQETLCFPLMAQRETLGLIYLEAQDGAVEWDSNLDAYLDVLAENIGLALANLHLREALRAAAMVDPLTGLANRRQLDHILQSRAGAASHRRQAISCLMVDVDHFKHFNDEFGHDAGDHVLMAVGSLLRDCIREPDLAFRFGGEEFLLLLPDVDAPQAEERAEEIRRRIKDLSLTHEGRELGRITASIGVASAPEHCLHERLMHTADAALLDAKENGRDRVVVAPERDRSTLGDLREVV